MRHRTPHLALVPAALAAGLLVAGCQQQAHDPVVVESAEAPSAAAIADAERAAAAPAPGADLPQRMEDVRNIEGEQERIDAANQLLEEQQALADAPPTQ
jgi:hypothetical protein